MKDSGLKVLPDMRPESFSIDQVIEDRLKEDDQLYQNFIDFPDLYKRIRVEAIQGYKHEPAIFDKRLDKFIENTRQNKMYGQ